MADSDNTEQIPNHLVIAELERQLHTKTSELVLANARVRVRDEKIAALQETVRDLEEKLTQV